jgi:anti-sigma regulatory factor (Ser/Thr protein kinase)
MRTRHEHGRSRDLDRDRSTPQPLASLDGQPTELGFTIDGLGALRNFVMEATATTSLGAERAGDLVLAVNELATNSICHGGGEGTLRVWREERTLLCEVRDGGHIGDVEACLGREAPGPDAMTGRGLWLVDQLCDGMQITSSPHAGSAVRVRMQLP